MIIYYSIQPHSRRFGAGNTEPGDADPDQQQHTGAG